MKYALEPSNLRSLLSLCKEQGFVMSCDWDGTLAPFEVDPSRVRALPGSLEMLQEISRRVPVLILSGRSRADLNRFLSAFPRIQYAGNHGLELPPEWGLPESEVWSEMRRAAKTLREELESSIPLLEGGVRWRWEDKGYSFAIHFRGQGRESEEKKICSQMMTALYGLQESPRATVLKSMRLEPGSWVINLIPKNAGNKATALRKFMRFYGRTRAIYLGDDTNDEPVFRLARSSKKELYLAGIQVGDGRDLALSEAGYFLKSIEEVLVVLEQVLKTLP